jgi:hypothetical protein
MYDNRLNRQPEVVIVRTLALQPDETTGTV